MKTIKLKTYTHFEELENIHLFLVDDILYNKLSEFINNKIHTLDILAPYTEGLNLDNKAHRESASAKYIYNNCQPINNSVDDTFILTSN